MGNAVGKRCGTCGRQTREMSDLEDGCGHEELEEWKTNQAKSEDTSSHLLQKLNHQTSCHSLEMVNNWTTCHGATQWWIL